MSSLAIDTLRYVKRLKAAGFTEEQAEVQAEALVEAVRETLVTKTDLAEAVATLRGEVSTLRNEVSVDLQRLEGNLRVEIRDSHAALLRWLIPLMVGQTAVIAALVRLL